MTLRPAHFLPSSDNLHRHCNHPSVDKGRATFKRVVKHGKDDVFVRHLLEQLDAVTTLFVDASSRGVLRVTEHQFKSAQLILNAFGDSKRVLRYTWKINPAERLFEDAVWRKHFELTSTMAMSGAMEVRMMAIVENRQHCELANVQKLLEFCASQEGLNAKVILNADWDCYVVDYAIPSSCIEFGVYGENLLYTADAYAPVSVGSWSRDPIELKRFTQFFDAIWNSQTVAANILTLPRQKVSLSQLISVDSVQERRQSPVRDSFARIEERMRAEVA